MTATDLIGYSALAGTVLYLVLACQYPLILRRSGFIFLPAFLFSSVWSLAVPSHQMDFLFVGVWSASFLFLFRQQKARSNYGYLLWLIPAASVLAATWSLLNQAGLREVQLYAFVTCCIGALLITEQLIRNYAGLIKAIGIGIGALLLYNLYLYASSLIYRSQQVDLVQARFLANFSVAMCLVIAPMFISHHESSRRKLGLSRPLVFTTSSLVVAGGLLITISVISYAIRLGGDQLSGMAIPFLEFLAILGIGFILSSSTRRARVRVWLNKTFFRTKYDYNVEWRNLSDRLIPTSIEYAETATRAIIPIFQGTGGVCYLRDGDHFVPRFSHNPEDKPRPIATQEHQQFFNIMREQRWIFTPLRTDDSMAMHNELLPPEIRELEAVLLVIPLTTDEELLGFVTISASESQAARLDWEDLDLVRMVARHVSNFVAYQMLSDEVVIARQFDAFHQFTTFVVHDLKNLIAQQALVVENANRFIDNPEFVRDAIKTIDNSVRKMTWMLSKLSQKSLVDLQNPQLEKVSLNHAIETAIGRCKNREPAPSFKPKTDRLLIEADEENLVMALTHLITNAQEACQSTDRVEVLLQSQNNFAVCQIIDTGSGMDADFVRNRLFKPFDSTKKNQGMGVGAYQCKQILSKMGGQVEVSSQPGEGTCFTIRMPLQHAQEIPAPSA